MVDFEGVAGRALFLFFFSPVGLEEARVVALLHDDEGDGRAVAGLQGRARLLDRADLNEPAPVAPHDHPIASHRVSTFKVTSHTGFVIAQRMRATTYK